VGGREWVRTMVNVCVRRRQRESARESACMCMYVCVVCIVCVYVCVAYDLRCGVRFAYV